MKRKCQYAIFVMFIGIVLFLTGCGGSDADSMKNAKGKEAADQVNKLQKPQTNEELFEFIVQKWKDGEVDELYPYASTQITALMDQSAFSSMFTDISEIAGSLQNVQNKTKTTQNGMDIIQATLAFTNATVELQLSVQNVKICGLVHQLHFQDSFEIAHENGVTERCFLLESEGYSLNAVYTFSDKITSGAAVLLIAGSGPSDCNETVGLLTPLKDIALQLASQGISSLRVEKRTNLGGDAIKPTDGVEEEYLQDCRTAISFLMQQEQTKSVYLLGHSLGGQIATILAVENPEIAGMILWNSTARHLADVAYDQIWASFASSSSQSFNQKDQFDIGHSDDGEDSYGTGSIEKDLETIKNMSVDQAKGEVYYGASDYYWASYNGIDVVENIKNAKIPTLILNSSIDPQLFAQDFRLWSDSMAGIPNITIKINEDTSHFGYKINMQEPKAIYQRSEFPAELITEFTSVLR